MEYLLLFAVPAISSINRIIIKTYKQSTKNIEQSSNIYMIIVSIVAMLVFAIMAKGRLIPNIPTILFSIVLGLLSASSNIFTLLALDKTDVVNTTMFSSAGTIAIPFLFGTFFLKETVDIFEIMTFFILLAVVLIPLFEKKNKSSKNSFLGYIYCVILFLTSGFSTVILKLYSLAPNVLNTNVFCFWANVFMLPVALFIALKDDPAKLKEDLKITKPLSYALVVLTVVMQNLGTVLGVFVLKKFDITLYTLLNIPTALVLTALISSWLFFEKITKKTALSICLSILGIILSVI